MTSTTEGPASAATHSDGSPPSPGRQESVTDLLARTGRKFVPIRRSFVQIDRGPGPLAQFLTNHDERGLEAYLFLHAKASAHPWNCVLPSGAWVRVLGLGEDANAASAKAGVSKAMRRLADRKLITRSRSRRLAQVHLLMEDGSGEPFTAADGAVPKDRYLKLPHTYWSDGYFEKLRLPAKVMLLVALSRPDGFALPLERAKGWYGVSADSADEGFRQLRNLNLLTTASRYEKTPSSETGWTERMTYTLTGPFSSAEQAKAAEYDSPSKTDAEEVLDLDDLPDLAELSRLAGIETVANP